MIAFLDYIFNTIDNYCPPSAKIDIKALNQLDKGCVQCSSIDNRKKLLEKFPNSPDSPRFIGAKEMKNMIGEAKSISSLEFYCNVKSNGKWDFKRLSDGKKYEKFGNYAFGVLAQSNGWNERVRDIIVGIYQIKSGTSKFEWIFSETFGDDPIDKKYIKFGVKDYDEMFLNDKIERDSFKDIYKEHICKPNEESNE
jgi:hypothetical protein